MKKSFITSGPEVTKTFSCSTQLGIKLILFINVEMPTIVSGWRNTTSESLKASFIIKHFSFYEQVKFHAFLS